MPRKAKAAEPTRRSKGKKDHPPHAPTQAAAANATAAAAVMEATAAAAGACVYDTLPGLTLDFSPEEALDAPSSYPAAAAAEDATATYAVFRNEITAAGDALVDIPATDFFSLDVSAAGKAAPASPSSSVAWPAGAATPSSSLAKAEQPAQGSERAWFRGGRRFRSPMLQLHKG
jgi:non-canonical poly(A) RNA polymerase PAPD5/7